MTPILKREFRVRYHECDAFAHCNNTVYARYMQEAAFDAASEVGYGLDWCVANQRAFFIRSSDIEYLRPLLFGDRVVVTTWVDDMRRAQSRRRYDMHHATTGELVCRAHSRWVYVDGETSRPLAASPEMQQAFLNTEVAAAPDPGSPPTQPPLPARPYITRKFAQFRDIDQMQHMNNAAYLDYFEQCGHEAGAAFGWPPERLMQANGVTVIRRTWVEYLQPARMNDELELTAWLSDIRPASAHRHMTMKRVHDGATLATCTYLIAYVNLKTGAPMRWDKQLLADVADNISTPNSIG